MMASKARKAGQQAGGFILLAFVARWVNLTLSPVEVGHNWRQSTVLMVARNFYEQGIDLLHPRVDMAGQLSGITGMEFPLLNALHALVARAFGFEDWYGRAIVLVFSSWAMWSLFGLLKRVGSARWARDTTLLLVTSLWFIYSRKVMPDAFSCALVILGLHAAVRSEDTRSWGWAALGALAITAGVLTKLPSAILLFGALPLFKRIPWRVIALLVPGAVATVAWYFVWVPHLVEAYGFWHFFMGTSLQQGAVELWAGRGAAAAHVYDHAMKFTGFAAFAAGAWLAVRHRKGKLLLAVGGAFLAQILIALKAGDTFVRHDYYILPFIPFMAMLAAYAVGQIPKPAWRRALIALIALEGVANQAHDFFPSPNQRAILALEADLDAVCAADDLIVINSGANPAPLYFAHRKGWTLRGEEIAARKDELRTLGATHVVWLQKSWREGALLHPVDSAHWVILPLD